ncbi:MAG: hypothetical protein OXI41_14020 [Chloroflexota bacterium]|nr:hypothetical protein [Chloroflexota bacterium]
MLSCALDEPAFVLAWSAYEALTGLLLDDYDGSSELIAGALQTIEQAAFEGVISAAEQGCMTEPQKLCSAIVHGCNAPEFNHSRSGSLSTFSLSPRCDQLRQAEQEWLRTPVAEGRAVNASCGFV